MTRKERRRRREAETAPKATHTWMRWTDAEVALLTDYSLTSAELALKFGRTFYAVEHKRARMRSAATHD